MKGHFRTIPEHPRPHSTNLQDRWMTRGTVPDPARLLGLIADPRNHGETDEGAIRLWTDFLNRQMRGNSTITILAIGQTSKFGMGFVGFFFPRIRAYTVMKLRYLPPTWDRYMPPRDTRDYDSSSRSHYSPPSGDRYRPMTDPYDSRDMFPHSRADSYRPSYDADGPWVNTPPQRVTRARSPGFAGRSLPTDDRHYSPPGMPSSSAHYRPHPQRMRHNRIVQRISSTQMRGSPSRNDLSPTGPRYPPDFRSTPDSSQSRNLMANAPSFGRKRSTSPFRKEDESPSKRLRSLSPDRLSSLASSRRSSPCPVLMKDPPAPTPPMDHRSTRVSTEGVDQSAGMVICCFTLITQ